MRSRQVERTSGLSECEKHVATRHGSRAAVYQLACSYCGWNYRQSGRTFLRAWAASFNLRHDPLHCGTASFNHGFCCPLNTIASAAIAIIHASEDFFTLPHESHTNWIMEAPQYDSCAGAIKIFSMRPGPRSPRFRQLSWISCSRRACPHRWI